MPVVFHHFGGLKAAAGLDQPGFADLVELVHSGHAYPKISTAYRFHPRTEQIENALQPGSS
jgi:predicted TIM-barrel fold metal-dependent hydrolase